MNQRVDYGVSSGITDHRALAKQKEAEDKYLEEQEYYQQQYEEETARQEEIESLLAQINEIRRNLGQNVDDEYVYNEPEFEHREEKLFNPMNEENPHKVGYKDGKWHPYKDAGKDDNEGSLAIGPGIRLSSIYNKEIVDKAKKEGLTDEEMKYLTNMRLYQLEQQLMSNIYSYSSQPKNIQELLKSMSWQIGVNGLTKYKTLLHSLDNHDYTNIENMIGVSYKTPNGFYTPDINRNVFRRNYYLS